MMREWKFGLGFAVLVCCTSTAVADPVASAVSAISELSPVSAVGNAIYSPAGQAIAEAIKKGTVTPEQYFQAGDRSEREDDMGAAATFYRLAADGGHAEAQARIGIAYYKTSYIVKALEFFRKAAEQGNAEGMNGLAIMYQGGEGGLDPDLAEARKWYTRAADKGYLPALQKMVIAYCNGELGLDEAAQNSPEALSWIKRGVGVDYVPAVEALAAAYRSGKYGLAVDLKQADELDAKARKLKGIKEKEKEKKKKRL